MNSRMALITFVDGGGGGQISNELPSTPPHLPPGGALLPVYPFDPSLPENSLPPTGSSPGQLPPFGSVQPIRPGGRFIVKWLACSGLVLVPDNSLPSTPPPTGGQELPPTAAPK